VKNGQLTAYLEKLAAVIERHRTTTMALNQGFQS
jgi:hypothetical protein